MRLQIVVADFHPRPAEFAAGGTSTLPRLPALEALGACGRRIADGADWRAALARSIGRADLAACAPAAVAAAALNLPAVGQAWFATPVHLSAGIDHLRLHGAGLLRLDAAESALLRTDFARVFGGSGLSLLPLFGSLLLAGLQQISATTFDPAAFLGADIRRAPATGEGAAALRRLGTEIEMWLHEHPANQLRLGRGALPVNALWLWGGADSAATPAPTSERALTLPRAYADDGFSAGLWQLCGGESLALPAGLDGMLADCTRQPQGSGVIVVLSAAATAPRDSPLLRVEEAWFEPALRQLRAGSLSQVTVRLGGQQWRVSRLTLKRFWRRRAPWWEYFAR